MSSAHRRPIVWLGVLVLLIPVGPGPTATAMSPLTLQVTAVDFENAEGAAGIAVWDGAEGFPEGIVHALDTTYVDIAHGSAVAEFGPFPPGVYAVTVYHDQNDNQRLDKNWLGMPREAWGVSNDARPRLRAPRFDEARFDLGAGRQTIEIRVK